MYVVKITRSLLEYQVTIFSKEWSEQMLSYSVEEVRSRSFYTRVLAELWARKELLNMMKKQGKLEIINGYK